METNETVKIYKGWMELPRWAGAPEFIKNLAFSLDLELSIDVDKGWIRESIRFKVTGSPTKVDSFKAQLNASLNQYENDTAG